MQLTAARKRRYVAQGGTQCPFCGHPDLNGGFVEINAGIAEQPITCPGCQRTWRDVYRLTNVHFDPEEQTA